MQEEESFKINIRVTLSLSSSWPVVSDSLWPHGLQCVRLPCPSPTPRACSNSCPLSRWCHPTISSSVVPFSSCLQSSPASGSFLMSQFFTLGGQSISLKNPKCLPSEVTQLCLTLCDPMDCSTPGLPVHHHSWSLPKLMSVESMMPSNHLILCCPLLLYFQSFPASEYFQMSQFSVSGGQSIGVSASASVLPVNIQDWFPVGYTCWIYIHYC